MHTLQVDALSKRYWVPRPQPAPGEMSRLARVRNFFSVPLARELLDARELWALRDVSFEVAPATVLGVIGANGAGKSTLLKIIAKVIAPTAGRVRGRGRVVSLLELGAGFDDDSTARDNIFMNAALNGIPRAVVQRRFDEIVAFAEIEEFVDTKLQFYSSGMYLRLAFSVAINMEPSILLADEILAVGDIAFQERCLEKVRELARDTGLTVLFVSHDMEAVSRICDRAIWMKEGALHADGLAHEVVADYQNAAWALLMANAGGEDKQGEHVSRYGEILEVKLLSADGREIGSPRRAEDVYVRIRFRTGGSRTRARCAFELYSKGVLVLRSAQPEENRLRRGRVYEAMARIPANLLAETTYSVTATVSFIKGHDEEGGEYPVSANKALTFMVYGEQAADTSEGRRRKGVVNPDLDWTEAVERDVVRA